MLAWHNSAELKAEVLAEMKRHREQDDFTFGFYQQWAPEKTDGFRGCAIGCLVAAKRTPLEHVMDNPDRIYCSCDSPICVDCKEKIIQEPAQGWHMEVEELYGITQALASIIDRLFESHDDYGSAADFAVLVVESIPVGADLSEVASTYRHGGQISSIPDYPAFLLSLLANAPIGAPDNG